jgi:hypothetical protein
LRATRLPGLLEQEQPIGRGLVLRQPAKAGLAVRPILVDQVIVGERDERMIAALVIQVDGAVAAEPSEPAAEGTARIVLIGRHPPSQFDPDALAKLIGRVGIQAAL